ncbi:glycosyltransferase family 2 protein [Neotamlana laminarinivorans]|uniref:Glycosyltransferase n=1 Tax=Neotamlana laminarinivorans TaxID=2883124 RepID=A0A9X1I300_9FLAO|nr:glycosyltransferase family 2 protein [Tamlana laminarinivorans]MCB4799698.1 glycosyltransferase [Tamlana laminarinivorans]
MKLTIITINHNNLEGLKKTVESVTKQTFQALEYVVIDGGSTDGSKEYLEDNAQKFNYWVSEKDKGVYHAMNKGIAKAKGDYLLFLNSGDHFYSDGVLKENLSTLTGEGIIYFNLQVIEREKQFIKTYPKTLSFSYFLNDTLPHPATFIKKEVFAKTNSFKEDFKVVSDWKFFIDAICKNNISYKYVNNVLSTFYIGGISSNAAYREIKFKERNTVLNSNYSAFMQDLDDVVTFRKTLNNLRQSRIIKLLVKLGFLNKF